MNFADTQLLIISQITTRAHKRYLYVRRQVGVMCEREMWDCCGKGRLQLANSDACDIPPPSTFNPSASLLDWHYRKISELLSPRRTVPKLDRRVTMKIRQLVISVLRTRVSVGTEGGDVRLLGWELWTYSNR